MTKRGKSAKGGKALPLLEADASPAPVPENAVCADFLQQLQSKYGYTLEQIALNVRHDEFIVGLGRPKADIVVWKSAEDKENNAAPFIVAQGKAQGGLRLEDYFEGIAFARGIGGTVFVSIDNKNTTFYKLNGEKLIAIETPEPDELQNSKKIDEALSHDENFKRDEFKKLLLKCHNVIRNNDKFSPEMAFDEISKVMFAKIWYEREKGKLLTETDLRKEQSDLYEEPFYQAFFRRTKKAFAKDEIFEETDKFKIREESFYKLVNTLEKYNLAEILDDVKGLAFEEFLGTTFRGDLGQFFTPRTVVDFMADILDPQEGELIADPCCGSGGFLIKSFDLVKDAINKEIKEVKLRFRQQVIDENFSALSHTEQAARLQKLDEICAKLNQELSPKYNGQTSASQIDFDENDKQSRLYKLSNNCIFGTDAEPRSARTAKMNMIMRGDGHSGVHHHDGLLHVNGMLREHFDIILTNPPFGARISRDLLVTENDLDINREKLKKITERYDPKYLAEQDYVAKYDKEQDRLKEEIEKSTNARKKTNETDKNKTTGVPVLDLFDTGKEFLDEENETDAKTSKRPPNPIKSTLTEVVFMERCLDLLKPGGRMGIVLPEGFLNTMDLQLAREYFEGRAKLTLIASIPQDVFIAAGATVKPSLVFLKRFTIAEAEQHKKITAEVTAEIDAKYQPQIDKLTETYEALEKAVAVFAASLKNSKADLSKKGAGKQKLKISIEVLQVQLKEAKDKERQGRKECDRQLKEIANRKKREIVQGVKDKFDYEFQIVQAEHAGVTSTGAKGKNDFPDIEQEFKQYRAIRQQANDPLWLSRQIEYEYTLDNFILCRQLKPKETAVTKKNTLKVSVQTEVSVSV